VKSHSAAHGDDQSLPVAAEDAAARHQGFSGPLFIVGRPRSGTKLLRTLLNENPRISIPDSETNIFPEVVARFGDPPHLEDPERLDEFYRRFANSFFFDWRLKFDEELTETELAERADLNSWSSIIETILKYYSPKMLHPGVVWGDKSPTHLTWMPSLKSLFPEARFLHILRDPRDLCLSAKKAWGKHPYRSAVAWAEEVDRGRVDGKALGNDYMEITYEALLSDPVETLRRVCRFIEVDYTPAMQRPSVSHEELGDTTGQLQIVSDNIRKYASELSPRTVKRIEEITYPTMIDAGYAADYAGGHRPLHPTMDRLLELRDGVALTLHYTRVKGPKWGVKYLRGRIARRFRRPT